MNDLHSNRFHAFYQDGRYLVFKNHLYNYLLRKKAIRDALHGEGDGLILEVGCGISPATDTGRVFYSDLSPLAMQIVRSTGRRGHFVGADAVHLPFKSGSFRFVICSEVLEHLPTDREALAEISRVMDSSGSLVLTFPHRHLYFARDDRFVGHYRRYELSEVEALLRHAGLKPVAVSTVLGPSEKATMFLATLLFSSFARFFPGREKPFLQWPMELAVPPFVWLNRLYAALLWMEARVIPRAWATVLLIKAVRYE